jgi:hypothetical protein
MQRTRADVEWREGPTELNAGVTRDTYNKCMCHYTLNKLRFTHCDSGLGVEGLDVHMEQPHSNVDAKECEANSHRWNREELLGLDLARFWRCCLLAAFCLLGAACLVLLACCCVAACCCCCCSAAAAADAAAFYPLT